MRKAIATLFLIAGFLLGGFSAKACAEECTFTFQFPATQNIVVTYDRLQMCEDILKSKSEIIAEQDRANVLIQEANERLIAALTASEEANMMLKRVVQAQEEMAEIADKQCKEAIDKAKPGSFQKLGWAGLGSLTTVIFGAVLILL